MDYFGMDAHEFAGDHDEIKPEPEEWLDQGGGMPYDWERDSGERPRPTGLMLTIAECRLVLVLLADDGSPEYRDLIRRLRGVIDG